MGGSINVDSEVGKGTILTLNLVLSTESATQSRTANQISGEGTSTIPAEADKGTSSSMRGTPRILLVEDHVVNQKVACGFLETLGCAIDLATNGREAVAMTEATDYDLVLMDVQMPEMDGLTATAKIRERETTGHVPIVAMTARAMQGDREHCIEAGMDDYITKPLQLEVIRTILEGIGHTSCVLAQRPSLGVMLNP
jgi:CheY-like chemotaxis protein